MADKPIRERQYRAFLSHAHVDKLFVDGLHELLARHAGLPIWYDSTSLQASKAIATELPEYISQCQGVIIVLSQASITSGWVKEEYNYAVGQRARYPAFQVLPIRIDDCSVPGFLETTKWVNCSGGRLDFASALQILNGFYDYDVAVDLQRSKDVYVSRSWRASEETPATAACRILADAGFRLVGDSEDQFGFEEGERVSSIMSSCGGFLAVVPHRGNGTTSKYILREIELARQKSLPGIVVVDSRVALPDAPGMTVIKMAADAAPGQIEEFTTAVEELIEAWRKPTAPHYVFFATDLDASNLTRNQGVRQLVQCITGMPCIMGEDIRGDHLQSQIQDRIAGSLVMIADISEDNLNTCIEAGIARGVRAHLYLVAHEPRRRPPFMFRDLQVFYYADEMELLGVVHRILRPYRRRVINYELC